MQRKKLLFYLTVFYFIFIGEGCTNQRIAVDFPKIDATKAFSYLLDQVNFGPRYIGIEAHVLCGDYIHDQVKKYADKVEIQNFTVKFRGKDTPCKNIIAYFNGKESSKTYLVGAHYDTRPIADKDKDPSKRNQPIFGANDGASGVAVLLSIAESLSKLKHEKNIILVFFDAEDLGNIEGLNFCLGSEYFAKNVDNNKIDYGIIVDMIGDSDLLIYKEVNSLNSAPDLVTEVWRAAWMQGYSSNFSYQQKHYVYDDHVPLISAGIPSIDIIDFDYPYWHTLSDVPDFCSPQSLEKVGNSLLNFIYNSTFGVN
ncbi:DUF4910 domain-containing protein [bacterium]|nr:DUF4910 domain-containing protein [bacterium]